MRKQFTLLILAALDVSACGSTPKFSDVSGKEWLLVEIRAQPQNVIFDRNSLKAEGFENIFTLKFDADRLSGIGAPNRYSAPYQLDANQAIKVQPIAGTLMAPIREPEKLKEHDFFGYLQNAYKWNYTKGRMELFSKSADGAELVLIFNL
jgi:heat shock protein HslJ